MVVAVILKITVLPLPSREHPDNVVYNFLIGPLVYECVVTGKVRTHKSSHIPVKET